jgi:hypothetical protein
MFPERYELGFYIPDDAILHSHSHENLKSYVISSPAALCRVMIGLRKNGVLRRGTRKLVTILFE